MLYHWYLLIKQATDPSALRTLPASPTRGSDAVLLLPESDAGQRGERSNSRGAEL